MSYPSRSSSRATQTTALGRCDESRRRWKLYASPREPTVFAASSVGRETGTRLQGAVIR